MEALLILFIAGMILLGVYTSRKKLPRTSRDPRIHDSGVFYSSDSSSSFIHSHTDDSHSAHYDHGQPHSTLDSDWSSSDSGTSSFGDSSGGSSDGGGGGDSGGGGSSD